MTKRKTKTQLFLFFFFFFFATGEARSTHQFDYKVNMIGFTPEQEEKVIKALELIKQVVTSEEFMQRVTDKRYNGHQNYVDSHGLSNQDIYQKIIDGAEVLYNPEKNNTMDLELELYEDLNTKTIGYTYPNVKRIWMNAKFFNTFQPHQVADNLMHEWLHKLGFKHAVKYSPSRSHSVPYSVGYLVKDLVRKHQQAQTAE